MWIWFMISGVILIGISDIISRWRRRKLETMSAEAAIKLAKQNKELAQKVLLLSEEALTRTSKINDLYRWCHSIEKKILKLNDKIFDENGGKKK